MALRYVGLQIAQARSETGETDYTDDNGVPQSVFVQALKEGVIHCQNALYLAAPQIFDVIGYLDAVIDQVEYDLPENAFLGSALAAVEFSASGENTDYYRLNLIDYAYRVGGSGNPSGFTPYGDNKMIVDPACASTGGQFRFPYGANLDEPALRIGKVASATKDVAMENYLTIVLENDSTLDGDTLSENEYVCLNDKDGVVKYYNAHYSAYDSTTKTLTLDTDTSVEDGTIAVGDYVTAGKYSTTHIKLAPVAEPILLAFMRRRAYLEKSSDDRASEEDNIAAFTKEMVAVYKRRLRMQKKIAYTGRFDNLGRRL
jgi:hypothetical protein